ncbi:hypothetical protein BDFB_013473 [Asbolus verrucosus]|uniref:Uncharacterized protein n=1 Tax=Asbolus verrucosus TaxID=1661398 RepID=A0A482VM67_ASBVE|nr:hypothetical protein BDFB_013473 [Asbolus verrucosus]
MLEYSQRGLKKPFGNNVRLENLPVAATFVKIDFLGGWLSCDRLGHNMSRPKTTLNAHRYVHNVLESVLLPFMQTLPNGVFQQDNNGYFDRFIY